MHVKYNCRTFKAFKSYLKFINNNIKGLISYQARYLVI